MRVFYEDYESTTRYYVKIENVNLPQELRGYKAFDAVNTSDLITQIIDHYGFYNRGTFSIQLWSDGVRLDTLEKIPKENEFLWARVVTEP